MRSKMADSSEEKPSKPEPDDDVLWQGIRIFLLLVFGLMMIGSGVCTLNVALAESGYWQIALMLGLPVFIVAGFVSGVLLKVIRAKRKKR